MELHSRGQINARTCTTCGGIQVMLLVLASDELIVNHDSIGLSVSII